LKYSLAIENIHFFLAKFIHVQEIMKETDQLFSTCIVKHLDQYSSTSSVGVVLKHNKGKKMLIYLTSVVDNPHIIQHWQELPSQLDGNLHCPPFLLKIRRNIIDDKNKK
jgi:hypothetical protein